MKTHYSIQELVDMKLEGWPATRQAFEYRAKKEGWPFMEVKANGGRTGTRREYTVPSILVQSIKAQMLASAMQDGSTGVTAHSFVKSELVIPESNEVSNVSHLADWQRDCAIARFGIVKIIESKAAEIGKNAAVQWIVEGYKDGSLSDDIMDRIKLANAKSGENRGIGRRSVFDWCTAVTSANQRGISAMAVLAPKERAQKIPAWAPALLTVWGQPQKPNLTAVIEQLPAHLPQGVSCPTYQQARYFLTEQMGAVEREKGRMGTRQLKNIKPFVRRDTTELLPTDVYTMDGHCFDAEVAHPIHGRPFRPEITGVLDVGTRLCVGWSVDLAESGLAVLDAIRKAAEDYGIPAMIYVDNGSGYENTLIKAQGRGLMDQMSTTMTNSLPYNSQAKGIIERSHKSIWIKAAKKLPTYMGADMDQEARQKVFKVTRADIKAFGRSQILIDFPTFREFCIVEVTAYNNKPHRGLPKIRDTESGKIRHQTPAEAWQIAVSQGFKAVTVDPAEADTMFRPHVVRAVRRGEVELFGNRYFSAALEQYHGKTMAIGYEIHNPDHIWVHDDDGRLVAKATWNSNRTNYFPKAVIETNRETRAKGRLRRLAVKQSEVLAELNPTQMIDHIEGQSIPLPKFDIAKSLASLHEVAAEHAASDASIQANARVIPMPSHKALAVVPDTEESKIARWMRLDDEFLTDQRIENADDAAFHRLFQKSKSFIALIENDEALRLRMESSQELRGLIESKR